MSVLLFRNRCTANSTRLSRADGNIGWIDPELDPARRTRHRFSLELGTANGYRFPTTRAPSTPARRERVSSALRAPGGEISEARRTEYGDCRSDLPRGVLPSYA
jgi:hypothetical protein